MTPPFRPRQPVFPPPLCAAGTAAALFPARAARQSAPLRVRLVKTPERAKGRNSLLRLQDLVPLTAEAVVLRGRTFLARRGNTYVLCLRAWNSEGFTSQKLVHQEPLLI